MDSNFFNIVKAITRLHTQQCMSEKCEFNFFLYLKNYTSTRVCNLTFWKTLTSFHIMKKSTRLILVVRISQTYNTKYIPHSAFKSAKMCNLVGKILFNRGIFYRSTCITNFHCTILSFLEHCPHLYTNITQVVLNFYEKCKQTADC